MRWVFFGSLIFALLMTSNREPQAAPWCLQSSSGTVNCGFYTYHQCRETLWGIGGNCERNLWEYAVLREPSYRTEPYPAQQIRHAGSYRRHAAPRNGARYWHTVRESRGWLIQRQARTGAWRAIPSNPGYRVAYRWDGGAWVPVAYRTGRS